MKKWIAYLCVACLLLVSGCGKDTQPQATSNSTSASVSNSQTSASEIITAPTAPSASEHNTTTSITSSAVTSAITQTTSPTTIPTPSSKVQHTTLTAQTSTTTNVTTLPSTTTSATTTTSTATTTRPNVIFIATVRNDKGQPVSGVTVSVWASVDVLIGQSVTGSNGVARITLESKLSSYRVKLSNIPTGYEADAEYRFSTNTVNISLRTAAVQDEQDHSNAQYDVGKTMTDFTLTDTNGNTYRLSNLLKDKQLIILDFWFANCQPCRREFPFFETAVKTYGDDLALLAINPIDSLKTILALRNQFNANPMTSISFPMLQDTCKLFLGFEVTAYPTTIFVDADGHILDIHVGSFPNEEAFLSTIAQYLQ